MLHCKALPFHTQDIVAATQQLNEGSGSGEFWRELEGGVQRSKTQCILTMLLEGFVLRTSLVLCVKEGVAAVREACRRNNINFVVRSVGEADCEESEGLSDVAGVFLFGRRAGGDVREGEVMKQDGTSDIGDSEGEVEDGEAQGRVGVEAYDRDVEVGGRESGGVEAHERGDEEVGSRGRGGVNGVEAHGREGAWDVEGSGRHEALDVGTRDGGEDWQSGDRRRRRRKRERRSEKKRDRKKELKKELKRRRKRRRQTSPGRTGELLAPIGGTSEGSGGEGRGFLSARKRRRVSWPAGRGGETEESDVTAAHASAWVLRHGDWSCTCSSSTFVPCVWDYTMRRWFQWLFRRLHAC